MTSPNFEFEEPEEVEASHLLQTQCQKCGTSTLAVAQHVSDALCGPCRGGSVVGYSGEHTSPVGYPREIREWVEPVERIEHPEPEVGGHWCSSDEHLLPGPVLALRIFARAREWDVRVCHSRGNGVHGSTGRPTAVRDVYVVHCEGWGRKAVAVYGGGTWASVWLLPRLFGLCSLAELKEWLSLHGAVDEGWYARIKGRVVEDFGAGRARDDARKFLKESGLSEAEIRNQFGLELDDLAFLAPKSKKAKEGAS